ncbi:DUF349 domain-containing protein [Gordonia rubripertincta]|uniref:DUF349 domain-containing protein n=1 Tax=Gordonia rubripertincta NBRC 101908 TaxID=1077975 RepID=A0ABQ0HVL0_GORRU|nr:DUF349 domain-containing protein [Gordonia rubripertincta]NKY63210.1 DUF349 domain-containing protein [Gordonia rubripertincta]GAB86313.1 hypothetical protein GORBP_072_00010 [Gordonia rubripertincta NBRC 101908]
MPAWSESVIHGSLDDGRYVTLKFAADSDDVLVALGHLSDIQPWNDHVHIWRGSDGKLDHHDRRWSAAIFPSTPGKDEQKSTRNEYNRTAALQLENLVKQARATAATTDWRAGKETMDSLRHQWNSVWRDPRYTFRPGTIDYAERDRLRREFREAQDTFFENRRQANERRQRDQQHALERREGIVAEAHRLAASTDWKATAARLQKLDQEWKAAGSCRREDNDRLWQEFKSAKDSFYAKRTAFFETRDRDSERAKRAKEDLVREAERLVSSTDWKATGDQFRRLQERWKATGHCKKNDSDRLWQQFSGARDKFNRNREKHFENVKADQAKAVRAKQSLVSEAQSLSRATDLRSARQSMKGLMDRWKAAPRASRTDEDKLWQQFRQAQDELRRRSDVERQNRQREQQQARSAKERLVSRAESLSNTSDFKLARQEMRTLMDEWKAAGRAERDVENQLWERFQRARDRFNQAANAAWENQKRERVSRLQDAIQRKKEALSRIENAIRSTESQLSDLYSRPKPSYKNPRRWEIASRRNEAISNKRNKLASMQGKRNDIVNALVDMEAKLRSMY